MQVLGGDPEAAYLTVLCASGYAAGLAATRAVDRRPPVAVGGIGTCPGVLRAPGADLVDRAARQALVSAAAGPDQPWVPPTGALVALAWGVAGAVVAWNSLGKRGTRGFAPRMAGLAVASALALAVSGAQVVPVAEFIRQSFRSSESGMLHNIYLFSVHPLHVVDAIWPNVFGTVQTTNRILIVLLPPKYDAQQWIPSFYLGGLTLVLALASLGVRDGPPWRAWLTGVAVVRLLSVSGSTAVRFSGRGALRGVSTGARTVEVFHLARSREEGFLLDGDGGVYWLLASALPVFGSFRYSRQVRGLRRPGRLRAGRRGVGPARRGPHSTCHGRRGRPARGEPGRAGGGLARRCPPARPARRAGPVDAVDPRTARRHGGDRRHSRRAGPGEPVDGIGLGPRGPRPETPAPGRDARRRGAGGRPRPGQLASRDRGPASDLRRDSARREDHPGRGESQPFARSLPCAAGGRMGSPGMAQARLALPVRRDDATGSASSLRPDYGMPLGVRSTFVFDATELFDYGLFFLPTHVPIDESRAPAMGLKNGERSWCHPRRGFDLWNTRYFLVPAVLNIKGPDRGYAAFVPRTTQIYPRPGAFDGPDGEARRQHGRIPTTSGSCQRGRVPRAWIVHRARVYPPIQGLRRPSRRKIMQEILFQNDEIMHVPDRPVHDPHRVAWVETDRPDALTQFSLAPTPTRRRP